LTHSHVIGVSPTEVSTDFFFVMCHLEFDDITAVVTWELLEISAGHHQTNLMFNDV
jgi:hypothetical protein